MFHIIYRVTNLINGRFYIGLHSTKKLNDTYMGSGKALGHAIRKYGRTNFLKEIMFIAETRDQLIAKEKELVALYLGHPLCYNMKEGGSSREKYHKPCKEETRKKISEANKKLHSSEKGEEVRKRISETVKKRFAEKGENYWTPEGRKNMALSGKKQKGRNRPRTLESRIKQSKTMKGRKKPPFSQKWKNQISASRKGLGGGERNAMANPENRKKVGESKIGRRLLVSPEGTRHYVKADEIDQKLAAGYIFAPPKPRKR